MRVISFSADGLREAADKGFYDWVLDQDADFICIQDLRCSEYDLQDDLYFPGNYNAYFFDDVNGRENGVAIYCRQLPKAIMTGLGFADFDMQGRYIQADYQNLSVGCLLVPEGGDDAAQKSKEQFLSLLGAHLQKVRNKRRRYVIAGNWQMVAGAEDLQDPEAVVPGEEAWLGELLESGYADAFRCVSGDDDMFSYWPQERGSDGRRSDLQIISAELRSHVEHGAIYTGAEFSRHAPLIMDYDLDIDGA